MAKLQITIKNRSSGNLVAHEEFELSPEVAQEFISKMELLVADLPGRYHTRKLVNANGGTVVVIELNPSPPPPRACPTFTELPGPRSLTTIGGWPHPRPTFRHPERVCRLMLAVALAYVWLCFLGSIALMTGLNKLVDRTDRRDRSLFTIGRLWLNRLLKFDKSILVGFFPYPFLSGIPPAGVG